MQKFTISIALMLSVTLAHAEIYKCTNNDGTVEFGNLPCSETAELIEDLNGGSQGVGAVEIPSSLTLGDGSVQPFKKIVSIEVKTETGYRTGTTGMHIFYDGTDHLVEFQNLETMRVLSWDEKGCGNTGHLCMPQVRIKTSEREIITRYQALRNIKVLVDDRLDGVEKEMTIWFGNSNKPHIRAIRF
jgi:hypothetical protein